MSRTVNPEAWTLGSTVTFDYYGTRLQGTIVRTSSNPCYFHIEVDGVRYEADLHDDHMAMVWRDPA